MPIFIKLRSKDRNRLFNLAKKKKGGSWRSLSTKFNVSSSMLFQYFAGKYDIPERVFIKLQKITGIKIEKYKRLNKDKYLQKKIKKPKMNSKFSEILGILNGDGYISKINYEICTVNNVLEQDYCLYIKNLFENNLNLEFKIIKQFNILKIRAFSKNLANLLNEIYGLPKGKKTGNLRIPKQVFNSKKWLISYIRGLFDTDGTIYKRRKKDYVLEIISVDKRFLNEVKKALNILGFKSGISGKNLYIYNKEDIKRFFKIIKPANSKHLKKFKIYSKLSAPVV